MVQALQNRYQNLQSSLQDNDRVGSELGALRRAHEQLEVEHFDTVLNYTQARDEIESLEQRLRDYDYCYHKIRDVGELLAKVKDLEGRLDKSTDMVKLYQVCTNLCKCPT